MSRPSSIGDSWPVRFKTTTCSTIGRALDGFVGDALELDDLAVEKGAVAGDDDARLRVLDPAVQRLGREAAVHDRMDGADLGAGQHRDRQLGHAAHVDGDPVALLDAERLQHAGELADLAVEGVKGECALVAVLALPDEGQLVVARGLQMPVDGVVDDVRLGADEPLVERLVRVVEDLRPGLVPVDQLLGAILPEADEVLVRPAARSSQSLM